MNGRIFFRIVLGLILFAGLIGIGVFIYNVGVSQGLAASGQVAAPNTPAVPYMPYAPFYYRPWGFGFFPFGLIFPLLFFLLIFFAIRGAFFRGWRGGGPRGWGDGNRDVPPDLEEWHRRMHETQDPNDR